MASAWFLPGYYTYTLVVYHSAKLAGKGSGLAPHLDSLTKRFAHRSPGKGNTPPAEK